MKIEVGESLMLSWLRHVKKCQSVQLNWKPSIKHWELSNEREIELIMQAVNAHYEERHSFNVFKNNKSYMQLLQQGELDALGLHIQNGVIKDIYGVDVAFHEAGLNYGSKIETLERVIKKIVRTAMLLFGYFNMRKGTIIFASPKINQSIYDPLYSLVKETETLLRSMELDFEVEIIANGEFKGQVINPILGLSSTVADTSELFLRSIQMYNMFFDSDVVSMVENNKPVRNEAIAIIPGIKEISIADFVRNTFSDLVDQNKLSKDKLYHLCDARYSKEIFLLPYPMLKKVNEAISLSPQRKDENGRDRYFAKPLYVIHGERYFLCNHWIEKSRKPYKVWFENWMNG